MEFLPVRAGSIGRFAPVSHVQGSVRRTGGFICMHTDVYRYIRVVFSLICIGSQWIQGGPEPSLLERLATGGFELRPVAQMS